MLGVAILISAQGIAAIASVINIIRLITKLNRIPGILAAGRKMFPNMIRTAPNTVMMPVKGTIRRFVNTDIIESVLKLYAITGITPN